MENGEWRMENGEWKMENGKWKMKCERAACLQQLGVSSAATVTRSGWIFNELRVQLLDGRRRGGLRQ